MRKHDINLYENVVFIDFWKGMAQSENLPRIFLLRLKVSVVLYKE